MIVMVPPTRRASAATMDLASRCMDVQGLSTAPMSRPLGAAVLSCRRRSRRSVALMSMRRSRDRPTPTTTIECCAMAAYAHPVSSLHRKRTGRFLTVVAHPQTLHLPSAHAGRDGQKPNQAVRPGGLLRSSGFQIRDAVPARIPTCIAQLTMQLGPFQLPGSQSGVGGHSRHERQTRTVIGTWGTRLGNILIVSAFAVGRKWLICRVFVDGASRDRTGDLLLAKQALSQLSYGPTSF